MFPDHRCGFGPSAAYATPLPLGELLRPDLGLIHLQYLPIRRLYLGCCSKLTDTGLTHLRRMPLTYLILIGAAEITDVGLVDLKSQMSHFQIFKDQKLWRDPLNATISPKSTV